MARKAAGADDCRAAGDGEGGAKAQTHLADRFVAAPEKHFHYAAEIVRKRIDRKNQTGRSGLPSDMADFAGTKSKTTITNLRRSWIMTSGADHPRSCRRTSRRVCTRTGAGTTTPAAASCSTGSGIIATSRIGAWIATTAGHWRSRGRASSAAGCGLEYLHQIPDHGKISQMTSRWSSRAGHGDIRVAQNGSGRMAGSG